MAKLLNTTKPLLNDILIYCLLLFVIKSISKVQSSQIFKDIDTSSIEFGFITPSLNKSICCGTSLSSVTITLYINTLQFQCQVIPNTYDTYYSCNTSNKVTTSECIYNPSSLISNGIQIDNDNSDSFEIDKILIIVTLFYIFQIMSTRECAICFMAIIIHLAASQTYPTNVTKGCSKQANIINCSVNYIQTSYYGGTGGGINDYENQGMITGISSWGIRDYDWTGKTQYPDTLWNLVWISDGDTIKIDWYGVNDEYQTNSCNPFIITSDDYINGYRIIYNSDFVYGLILYTNNNLSFECISSSLDMTQYNNSGKIVHTNYYLSGFYLRLGNAFDAISLEFTCLSLNKYILIENELSWDDANNYCLAKYGTYLATITTDNDLRIAHNIRNQYVYGETVWIGLTDKFNEGVWKWIDGTSCNYTQTGLCIDDENWSDGEPNDYGSVEDGAILLSDGSYNDQHGEYMFLCNNDGYKEIISLEGFDLCNKLSEYGCNLNENPLALTIYIEENINNYTLPTDPCLFDTIDIDWIFEQIPYGKVQIEFYLTLYQINDFDLRYQLPCQILVQIEDLLISNDIEYLIDYDYWFIDNGGECDTTFPNQNPYGTVVIPCNDNCTDSWYSHC